MGGDSWVPRGVSACRGRVGAVVSGAVQAGEGGQGADEEGHPGVVAGVAEPDLSAASGQGGGDRVEPVAEPFRFPPAGDLFQLKCRNFGV